MLENIGAYIQIGGKEFNKTVKCKLSRKVTGITEQEKISGRKWKVGRLIWHQHTEYIGFGINWNNEKKLLLQNIKSELIRSEARIMVGLQETTTKPTKLRQNKAKLKKRYCYTISLITE